MNNTQVVSAIHASACALPLPTRPLRFLVRLTLTSLAALWLAQLFSVDLVERLLPAFRAEVVALDDNISILGLDLAQDGPSKIVRLRANLLRPIYIGQKVVFPLGWDPRPRGWYEVYLNTRGVLEASIVLLIVVLSWPHRSMRELSMRVVVALTFMAVLIAIDAPTELVGNFRHQVLLDIDPHGFQPIFVWDKFLEGGGNFVLALAFAALAIVLAAPGRSLAIAEPQS